MVILNGISADEVANEIKRRELEKDFFKFVLWVFNEVYNRKFIVNWHHLVTCRVLQELHAGEIFWLIINMPPRYTKTELILLWIVWSYAKNKDCNFLYSSYSLALVRKNTGIIVRIITSKEFQELWPLPLDQDEKSKTLWSVIGGGSMRSVNSGGAVTGFGSGTVDDSKDYFGGALVIDDPNKAGDERYPINLEKVNENFDNVLVSRQNSKNTRGVIIMQRLHEEDLTGHILSGNSIIDKDKVRHICLKGLREDDPFDYDSREVGEALWVDKHSAEDILGMKTRNPMYFSGQMQQRPAPMEGNIVKREMLRRYSIRPEKFDYGEFISVDLNSVEAGGSNFVASRYGINSNSVYLLDQLVGQWDFSMAQTLLKDFVAKSPYTTMLIEAKANGHAMISNLNAQGYHSVIPIKVHKSKVHRMNEVSGLYNAGNVYYPETAIAPWIEEHILEMLVFPNGKNDDRVDAETQVLKYYLINLSHQGGSLITTFDK